MEVTSNCVPFSCFNLSAPHAASTLKVLSPGSPCLLTIISIFDACLTPLPIYVRNSLSHWRQTSIQGQSMALRIRRVSRNNILPARTTSAGIARTCRLNIFWLTKASPSLASGATPPTPYAPSNDTPSTATLSRPFCQAADRRAAFRAESCFICTRRIHQSGFYIT